ncbi:Teichuronic acid biosynthesis protein TuaB [Stieleria neptunia]|uniref:Teichuronic acid biosynthesis protein TuaB n=1 Tax=Stieleria neptunia TaxID=2527979 RepID=A0A518HN71_9BACT|nr:lipopolysaccharide biosynthesis protein [Stieleria neptunia]QDV42306.1 Teichuronic acid biosynthesis protein TuaB [Stieleria neptunia]
MLELTNPTAVADPFCTRDLERNLNRRSARGAFTTLFAQGCGVLVRVASLAVLSRLLEPNDFGLVAMALVITGFASMFSDAGLSMATIQRKSLNHQQASTLFWIVIAISLVLSFSVALSAPVVAWMYDDERLIWLTIALGTTFLFSGLSLQQMAILKRQMRLRVVGSINVGAQLTAFLCAWWAAANGWGYWALVVQLIAMEASRAAYVWFACPWRPGLPVRGSGVRSMLNFGGNLTASNFLSYLTTKVDSLLIGMMWGAAPLGFYSRAMNLLQLPRTLLLRPLNDVAIPALSRLQDDVIAYRSYYRRALLLTLTCTMPIMAYAAISSKQLILVVLGDQWIDAVPIYRALSIAAFCQTLDGATSWVNVSMGRTDRRLYWRLISGPITTLAVAIGVQWGALGAAIGFSSAALVLRVPGIKFCLRGMPVHERDVYGSAWRPACSVLAAALLTISLNKTVQLDPIPSLLLSFLVFVVSYLVGLVVVSGGWRRFADLYRLQSLYSSFPRSRKLGVEA